MSWPTAFVWGCLFFAICFGRAWSDVEKYRAQGAASAAEIAKLAAENARLAQSNCH